MPSPEELLASEGGDDNKLDQFDELLTEMQVAGLSCLDCDRLDELTYAQLSDLSEWVLDVPPDCDEDDADGQAALTSWRDAAPKFVRFTGDKTDATESEPARDIVEILTEETITKKYERLSRHHRRILEAEAAVANQANRIASLKSDVEIAKGELKAALERQERLVAALSEVIHDSQTGQQTLPFDDSDSENQSTETPVAESFPLASLLTADLTDIVGSDLMASQKESDDPIGLSEKQLEKLETACESNTVEGLEKWIAADAWWHQKIDGFGEKAIQRVVSTLLAFRRVHPILVETTSAEQEAQEAP